MNQGYNEQKIPNSFSRASRKSRIKNYDILGDPEDMLESSQTPQELQQEYQSPTVYDDPQAYQESVCNHYTSSFEVFFY